MFNIVLYEPEIPPNTGNIIRLTVNAGATLHLIHPLGFKLDDKQLKRAGMDYRELSKIREHKSFNEYVKTRPSGNIYAASTKGKTRYTNVSYQRGDTILFGPETRGLPEYILNNTGPDCILRIPMQGSSRSLNLSNAVSIILYEALRQNNFNGFA